MSESAVTVVRLGPLTKHPNADTLSLTYVHGDGAGGGYPCIIRTTEWSEGDLAVYVPVDSLVSVARREFGFLKEKAGADGFVRIRAAKLRGIFSMGLLVRPPESDAEGRLAAWREGDDVTEALGVRRYEPPWETSSDGQDVAPPSPCPPVYDLEGLRRWPSALRPGEPVVVSEKLHGSSARAVVTGDGVFHVGSHTKWKNPAGPSEWAVAAREGGLTERCSHRLCAGYCLYLECIGKVGGFRYGHQRGRFGLRVFDVLHVQSRTWLDYAEVEALCSDLYLPLVPILYRGPWDPGVVLALAEGPSTLDASHVREGIVIRPERERFDAEGCGRVVLKYHGEGFLAGKGTGKQEG